MKDAKRKLIPALAAFGGSLAAGQAMALEIGPIEVRSTLGEPLRASIAYALAPGEALAEYCVALRAAPGAAIPSISRASVSVDKGLITIIGSTVLREPLATLRVDISCPYTPRFSREYMLMIDPGSRQRLVDAVPARALESVPSAAAGPGVVTAAAARQPVAPTRDIETAPPALAPLSAGDRVFVEPGRTLSRIVEAVEDRTVDYAEAVSRIVAANPAAFIDGNPDRLEAGNWLSIPDLGAATLAAAVRQKPEAGQPATPSPAVAQEPPVAAGPVEPSKAETSAAAPPPRAEALTTSAPNAGVIDDTKFLQPASPLATADAGDGEPASVYAPAESDATVDAGLAPAASEQRPGRAREVAGTTIAASPPAQPTRRDRDSTSGTSNFWYWLIGGGAAIIAGLLALLYRGRQSTRPAAAERAQPRPNPLLERVKQAEGIEVEPIHAFTTPDFSLEDDSPTAENPTLDTRSVSGREFDDDGAIAADLEPDQHAHQDVDINLAAVRYEGGDAVEDRHADDVDLDLASGSGFDAGDDTQADRDFTFARTTALDFELPEESEATAPQPETDIIPPLNIEESSILKSEVLPDDHEDDDYDMSVILDATKQPDPHEVTEKDLHAVVLDAGDNTMNSGDYTVARDMDFDVLEQDYEEELSATQALNMEIERAALELANRVDDQPGETGDEAPTAIASFDDDPEAQLTEELPMPVASMDHDREPATDVALLDEEAPTDIGSLDDDGPTAVALLDEDDEPPTEIAHLDEETMEAALAPSDDEEPTAVAPLDDDDDPPTAILDDETIDAAFAATADEGPTAIAPLDDDGEAATDVSPLDQTSIEAQLAHLPGEGSTEAANDDPLFDDDTDLTGINAALVSEDITEDDKTVEIARDDEEPTIRLSGEADDDTVEMPPRSKNA